MGCRGAAVAVLCLVAAGAAAGERGAPGAASCSGCHAAKAAAEDDPAIPPLGRLTAAEIEAALAAYRSGARAGTIMPRIARGFDPREARAIAASLGRDGTNAP